jgi:sugar lactone lactonase YvrE
MKVITFDFIDVKTEQLKRKIFRNLQKNIFFFHLDTKWKQNGITMAGGNGRRNQLSLPYGIFIDDDQTIYIADCFNHRIVEWKSNATNGKIVAGGNGNGNRTNQLNYPIDVIIDKENNFFIISDRENRRVMRWSRQNNTNNGRIIIDDIDCYGLTMDKNGSLYVSDYKKNEVKRWKRGDRNGKIVAGGNGKGDYVNQLNSPTFIFVDEDYSLYVSDKDNHRVMKWLKGAKEGIVVVGGHGQGNSLKQLSYPQGVIVDQLGQIYVADGNNHRVMRWFEGAKEGTIVAGGNGDGEQLNQLYSPIGLSFDRQGNLYVADCVNHRIQKFEINETDDTFIELNDSLICNNDLVRPCFL